MKIKTKIKILTDFIKENKSEDKETNSITKKIKTQDLSKEIEVILNKLQKLEVGLDNNPNNITESIDNDLILEFTPAYNKGLEKGQKVGAVIGLIAVITFLKVRANRRIKKKQAAYTKYAPEKAKLEIDEKYSDQQFAASFDREEFIEKETEGLKKKYDKKISKLDPTNPKAKKVAQKLRADRDEKLLKLRDVLISKIIAKETSLKEEIKRKIEDLDIQWKRDDADTNIMSVFAKFANNPAGSEMQRKWEDWKLEFDRKVEDKAFEYERKLLDKSVGVDNEKLKEELEELDSRIKKFKTQHAQKVKIAKAAKAQVDQDVKDFEAKEGAKEEAKEKKLGPSYIKAKQKYNDYMESVNKFGQALSFAEKNTSGSEAGNAKTNLQKAYKTMRMRSNFSKANAQELMPNGTTKDYNALLKERQDQLDDFKKAYNTTMAKFKPVTASNSNLEIKDGMYLTEKLEIYEQFMERSKMSKYIRDLGKKMKDFFKAVGSESKETKEAVSLVYKASKDGRKLTDEEKKMVKEQLKDVLKTIGLSSIAIMPGGFIVAVLINALKLNDKIVPSSFKKK